MKLSKREMEELYLSMESTIKNIVAKHTARFIFGKEDAMSIASIGFMRAVKGYKGELYKSASFRTYLSICVVNQLNREITSSNYDKHRQPDNILSLNYKVTGNNEATSELWELLSDGINLEEDALITFSNNELNKIVDKIIPEPLENKLYKLILEKRGKANIMKDLNITSEQYIKIAKKLHMRMKNSRILYNYFKQNCEGYIIEER